MYLESYMSRVLDIYIYISVFSVLIKRLATPKCRSALAQVENDFCVEFFQHYFWFMLQILSRVLI